MCRKYGYAGRAGESRRACEAPVAPRLLLVQEKAVACMQVHVVAPCYIFSAIEMGTGEYENGQVDTRKGLFLVEGLPCVAWFVEATVHTMRTEKPSSHSSANPRQPTGSTQTVCLC